MTEGKRVIINITAQYAKAVINTVLSLYTVRIVLKILGQSDYGIMSLVGGIIMLLGFITSAMSITTQRHLSYDYGKKDLTVVRKTFSNSIVMHLAIGMITLIILLAVEPVIVSPKLLNIADGRWEATHIIYKIVAVILLITFLTSPFKALLTARENIVFVAFIETLDGFLKLAIVLILPYLSIDRLVAYGFMLLAIMLFEFSVFSIYDAEKYSECSPRNFFKDTDKAQLKRLSGFAGWTTYGTVTIIARNQGIAWMLNHFYGTVVNAAYGIANQMFSAIQFISASVLNAINPQIMKAEGRGERDNMWTLAELESKSVICLMTILFIPLMAEINGLLTLWIGKVPPYTSVFCVALLMSFLADQLTSGLNTANQAIGNIRNYSLLMYTPKLLLIPMALLLLYLDYGPTGVMFLFVAVELLVALIRLPYMHLVSGLDMKHYIRTVLGRNSLLIIFMAAVSLSLKHTSTSAYRFFYSIPIAYIAGIVFAWTVVLTSKERKKIKTSITSK